MTRPSDDLAVARGAARDGIAAIEGFLQVLASRRVGPRMLARAIPEVKDGCEPLRGALEALGRALAVELSKDPEGVVAVERMLAHAAARVAELDEALSGREQRPPDARERLALEAIVRRIAGDLSTVVRLVDLLASPVTSETTTIDIDDALAQRRPTARTGVTPILATIEASVRDLRVGDARLVLELLEFAVATVVRAGVAAPRILVENGPEGFPIFTVDAQRSRPGGAGALESQVLDVSLREALPSEADVVRAAARHAGIKLTVAPAGRAVTIAL